MASYSFHPAAAEEYLAATQYYLEHASELIAAIFVAEVEAAIQTLRAAPTRSAVIAEPQVRRYFSLDFLIRSTIVGKLAKIGSRFMRSCIRVGDYWRDRLT